MSLIFSLSVSRNAVYMLIMLPKTATDMPATMMVQEPLPSHTIRSGASADFGRLLRTTSQGSSISETVGKIHRRVAVRKLMPMTSRKLTNVSYKVTFVWRKRDPSPLMTAKVLRIPEGLLKMKESIQDRRVLISQRPRKRMHPRIRKNSTR